MPAPSAHNPAPRPGAPRWRRVVVKIGTNVIMREDGKIALGLLCGLVESVAALRSSGMEVLLVTSGAVGLGMERLALSSRPRELALTQACAAVGQSRLMALYDDAFDRLGCRIAQVLLTEDDFRNPVRYTNLHRTLDQLLALGVIPIANENDTVSTIEIEHTTPVADEPAGNSPLFGDNDRLSSLLAEGLNADLLILLSDVDGLYDRNPSNHNAQLVRTVERIDSRILDLADGGNGRGRGGMRSKLESARAACEKGRDVIIANGRTPQVLEKIARGEAVGTRFCAVVSTQPKAAAAPGQASAVPDRMIP